VRVLLLPPLPLYLLIAAGLLWARRDRRKGMILAAASLSVLALLSMPLVGGFLLRSLQSEPALDLDQLPEGVAEAIIVLGGDQNPFAEEYGKATVGTLTLERLRYASLLHHRTALPLLVSGGQLPRADRPLAKMMLESLRVDFGVEAYWIEDQSPNTLANARQSVRMLRDAGVESAYLVTHAWHMPRARACFEAEGFEVICAPMGFRLGPRPDPGDFLPSSKGLQESTYGMYEWLGGIWYRLRHL